MLAQPIIENAIEHGVRKIKEKGLIEISLVKESNQIIFTIIDNGNGFTENENSLHSESESYALKIIEERLSSFNKKNKLKIETLKNGEKIVGTKVSFIIPLKNA